MDFEAENVYQVFDWLWSSGQLSAKDITQLPSLKIDVVINLAPPSSSNALPREAELVTKLGIVYIQIPVEWELPDLAQLNQFFGVLKVFEQQNVWVHCAKNMRASTFIYLYRKLCLAESGETATFPMCEVWEPNETWQAFIRQVLTDYIDSHSHK